MTSNLSSALEVLDDNALYKSTYTLVLLYFTSAAGPDNNPSYSADGVCVRAETVTLAARDHEIDTSV